jgi:hypothetical protein
MWTFLPGNLMADYYSIITNRGKELEAEALANGSLIVLTNFVVGDSNGKQVKPDPAQIRLINETYRGDIAELVVSPEQSAQLMAKIVLPTGIGGFTVREVGLLTDAGELYAVANCPSIDKPVGGVSVNMQFRLAVSDTSNVTLNVATGDGLFLRIDQHQAVSAHSWARPLHKFPHAGADHYCQRHSVASPFFAVKCSRATGAITSASKIYRNFFIG